MSLDTMLTEIDKLLAVPGVGVAAGVFAEIAPNVVAGWRARAAVESPSHLRTHPEALRLTLVAALLREREREIADRLVEPLISTVHRVGARAERKVTKELVNAFKRVSGKESILFRVAEASLAAPDGTVRSVVFPAVSGGEQTLRELVHEFKTSRPLYRRTVQTTLKASYTNHYRRGLIRLLDILEFRSNAAHQPIIEALALIRRFAGAGNITYYPLGETVPLHRGLHSEWEDVVHREDVAAERVGAGDVGAPARTNRHGDWEGRPPPLLRRRTGRGRDATSRGPRSLSSPCEQLTTARRRQHAAVALL